MFRQAPSFPYHDLGIVEDGNTASRAISKDSYVIWKGSSYFASTDILQGATLEEDVNLTAIPDGVINGVVDALNNNLGLKSGNNVFTGDTVFSGYNTASGNYVDIWIPVLTNGKTVTDVSFSSPSYSFFGSTREGLTAGSVFGIISQNAFGVKVEIKYNSTKTSNVTANVLLNSLTITCA